MPTLADVNTCWPSTSNGFSQRGAQPLGDAHGVARVRDVVEQDRELVAAEPRQREPCSARVTASVDSQAGLQPARDGDEQPIRRQQPEAVR